MAPLAASTQSRWVSLKIIAGVWVAFFQIIVRTGAKVGAPERPVVAVCGDGGFAYNIQELATAKQHSIGAIAIVFNDNAFGNVRRCCSALQNSFRVCSAKPFYRSF